MLKSNSNNHLQHFPEGNLGIENKLNFFYFKLSFSYDSLNFASITLCFIIVVSLLKTS